MGRAAGKSRGSTWERRARGITTGWVAVHVIHAAPGVLSRQSSHQARAVEEEIDGDRVNVGQGRGKASRAELQGWSERAWRQGDL